MKDQKTIEMELINGILAIEEKKEKKNMKKEEVKQEVAVEVKKEEPVDNSQDFKLTYLKEALQHFCSQDNATQKMMIKAILTIVGCNDQEIVKAQACWTKTHPEPLIPIFKK